ncbi:MAG: outer membrane protein assembly factor BamE [Rhodobacteraceae bacterium]|jgi:outer membrane protein assembly factor BamE (lipoprotein component of BamABCDE complex)|uniref:outer membrane protein assembly factor BamE n=1 Tax=Albidovulum sp. TaxID=1872424 RepID=UPI001DE4741D|nr:outer membrane protein assembly factor BamE [uncultured Defluviimonas sp.]MCB2124827.1 outer membrane protein assembly factor BamE [Paracoccaceae bacterium]MCC0068494.1 outer membrane protein assembly factor BamE [Paracoccaceae bacterium]
MGRLGSGVRHGAFALLVALLAACTALYQNHGYIPRDVDLEQVIVGESTREDVAKAVGRPSSTGLLTGGAWYYVGSRFRHYGPREPQEIDRQVVAISFDEGGTVENVERFGLEKGQVVVLSRRVTDSNIKGLSFLRQLLGNIGNISAGQLLNNE